MVARRFKSKNAYGNWTHPRDGSGRFRPRLSQSVRASSRSVSWNGGARVPIVPGRLSLYTGVLIRAERTSTAPGALSKVTDKLVDGFVSRTGNRPGVSQAAELLKTGEVMIGGVRVQRSAIINSPTIRVSGAKQQRKTAAISQAIQTPNTLSRSPNRKPRTRSANRARVSQGSQQPKTISR